MYPGTVYEPHQPIFFQSVMNPYILRCSDGVCIDGNHRRISGAIYRSLHGRDRLGPAQLPICDVSWLCTDFRPVNPLNVGQIVNNGDSSHVSNVTYHECNLPPDFDPVLMILVPNNLYERDASSPKFLRISPLIAVRDIAQGEELFSSYFSLVE